jgi:hypothetical protein
MEIDLPLIYEGKDVTIVGGGSSLTNFDFGRLKGEIIAINHSIRFVPYSTAWVFSDMPFYVKNLKLIEQYEGYCISRISAKYVNTIKFGNSRVDYLVMKANNSGFTAMVVALMLGARKIYLLGFDGGWTEKSHFHNFYRDEKKVEDFVRHLPLYDYFKNFPIVNVGINSDIKCFAKVPIDEDFYKY